MDRGWIEVGSRMHRGWIEDGSRMDGFVGRWVGWLNGGPPHLSPPHEKKSHKDCSRKKTTLRVGGLDFRTCIERRLGHDWLDVFVGWLLIPTRRGVGGLASNGERGSKSFTYVCLW